MNEGGFFSKIRSPLISFVSFCFIIGSAALIIAYGRGYRFDLGTNNVRPTGLISVTSQPVGAQIFIDGTLRAATDTSFNIDPGWYTVTIAKEGYQPWEKYLRVQGEVVTRADALLLPANPSLTAITGNGVESPTVSPDGTKLAFIVPVSQPTATGGATLGNRAGIWVLDLTNQPLGLNRDARQIATNALIAVEHATMVWGADSKQLLVREQTTATSVPAYYLLETDRLNNPPLLAGNVSSLFTQWNLLFETKLHDQLATLAPAFTNIATQSMRIIAFSPDETKILYEATHAATLPDNIIPPLIGTNPTEQTRTLIPQTLFVYDIKEDRNYSLGSSKNWGIASTQNGTTPFDAYASRTAPKSLQWLATSRHLVYAGDERVEIFEYDGVNRKTVYAGPFWDTFVVPWTNASKLIILTNLNPDASRENNLYAINLR